MPDICKMAEMLGALEVPNGGVGGVNKIPILFTKWGAGRELANLARKGIQAADGAVS